MSTLTRILWSSHLLVLGPLLPAQALRFAISTYAGGPLASTPVTAVNTAIGAPQGITTDYDGNVYFTSVAPGYLHRRYAVFKLDTSGVLTRVAGDTGAGVAGDGGPAINAQFQLSDYLNDGPPISGIAVDSGFLFIADTGNSIVREVSPDDGIITTVAGNRTFGNSGDLGPATGAQISNPSGLAISFEAIYIVSSDRVRKVTWDGTITTAATATPDSAIAVDSMGNLFIAGGGSVRKISRDGTIATIAAEDGLALAVDGANNVYIAEVGRVRKIAPNGSITTVAGDGTCGYSGDGGQASKAQVCAVGIAVDREGNLYLADAVNQRVREISTDGLISTVAGNGVCCYSGDGAAAITAQLNFAPWGGGMAVDRSGDLYIADAANQRVRKISPDGIVTTVAGNGGSNGYSGDGGPATAAQLNYPAGVAVDSQGNLYIADTGNERLRKVSPDGIISTVANAGSRALVIDQNDNLYFVDAAGVHRLSLPAPFSATVTAAQLNVPFAAAADRAGNLYFAEIGDKNYRVRKIAPDGTVTTVAGDGNAGYFGDGGPAINAQLNGPVGLAVDSVGNLYIADTFNARIRMVSPDGVITTVAGTGASSYSGDGGPAIAAQLGFLSGLAIDQSGNLYAADQSYNAIRLLQPVGSAPVVSAAHSAASNLPGVIAPGEFVVFTGSALGPAQFVPAAPGGDGVYPAQLAGTSVLVNGLPAPLIYTSATQVAAMIPDSASAGMAQVSVTYLGQTSFPFPIQVVPVAPAIFTADSTGRGRATTVSQDGSINTPVDWGDSITLFMTGAGRATSGSVIFWLDTSLETSVPITAGDVETAAGITRIKVTVPYGLDCDVPTNIRLGSASSQAGVTLAARVCI